MGRHARGNSHPEAINTATFKGAAAFPGPTFAGARCRRALIAVLRERFGRRVEIAGENTGVHPMVWLNDLAPGELDALTDGEIRASGRRLAELF